MAGRRRRWAAAVIGPMVVVSLGATAGDAQAQTFGIGGRMVWVTGAESPLQDPESSSPTKLKGVFMRLRASKRVGLEVSMDFRTTRDAEETIEVKSTPLQVSGLFYLLKGTISPYAVVGAGWYKTRVELLGAAAAGDASNMAEATEFGYHTGLGGEVMLGKHASIFVDYRYTFVDVQGLGGILGTAGSLLTGGFGSLLSTAVGIAGSASNATSPIPAVSHLGSMWTTGMTIYF